MDLYAKNMIHRFERVQGYSIGEYERRWIATRDLMAENGLDLLLIVNPSSNGFSDWLIAQKNCAYLLVSKEGDLVGVYGHGIGSDLDQALHLERTVGMKPVESIDSRIKYAAGLDTNYISSLVSANKRLGIVNGGSFRADVKKVLLGIVDDLELVDISTRLTMIKAVKSEEEKHFIMQSVSVYERIMAAIPMMMREGRHLRDILLEARSYAHDMGANSDIQLFCTQHGMEDKGQIIPMGIGMDPYPDETLKPGYRMFFLTESNTVGNQDVAIGRNFVLGDPHPDAVRVLDAAIKMQDFAAERLKPGNTIHDIYYANLDYIASLGFMTNNQNYMHGMGAETFEGPSAHDGSTEFEPLRADIHLLVHPHVRFDRGVMTGVESYDDMYNVDTFFVSPKGGIRANDVPREIIVV